jgi:hypothetical protein
MLLRSIGHIGYIRPIEPMRPDAGHLASNSSDATSKRGGQYALWKQETLQSLVGSSLFRKT